MPPQWVCSQPILIRFSISGIDRPLLPLSGFCLFGKEEEREYFQNSME